MTILVGTSGWSYAHWDGVLYPPALPPAKRLDQYVRHFRTVELNSSHYRWPHATAFASWRRRLPRGFTMSVKAPRGLTHGRRLYAPEAWLARIAEGMEALGPARGILLVQLPPDMEYDAPRLTYFLEQISAWLTTAFEFRHPSWHCEEVFALLARYDAAYCVVSGAGLPCILRATAPVVYVRLHGPSHDNLYAGSYSLEDLRWWAARCREWSADGHQVYAYFNNDGEGNAVRNASSLQALLQAA
jgi:uncharacterized protein YecE (DUF72 family)